MNQQEAYVGRIEAQMRAADARLDEMEASARAKNAQAEMNDCPVIGRCLPAAGLLL